VSDKLKLFKALLKKASIFFKTVGARNSTTARVKQKRRDRFSCVTSARVVCSTGLHLQDPVWFPRVATGLGYQIQ